MLQRTSAAIPRADTRPAAEAKPWILLPVWALTWGLWVVGSLSLLGGCSLQLAPTHTDAEWPCPYADSEISVLGAMTEAEFGEDAVGLTRDIVVQCAPSTWEHEPWGTVSGITLSPDLVRIAVSSPGWLGEVMPLRRTALSHEYVHAILWKLDRDPDTYHELEDEWDIPRRVRAKLYVLEEGCGCDSLGL